MVDSLGMLGTCSSQTSVGAHPSPYHTFSQLFTPRRLKDLFRWCEYLFYNSPQIYSALRKFGEYPITDITYATANQALKHKYKELLTKNLHARELLIEATLDKYVYGNAFISMYQPFIRFLKCPQCSLQTNIKYVSYSYSVKNLTFKYQCKHCHQSVVSTEKNIVDSKMAFSRRISFIRWDPKFMDIEYNEITGESRYYYTIPPMFTTQVNAGNKHLIDTLPLGFLKAIQVHQKFKFSPEAIYHMKVGGPAGISPQWGLPPLLSVMNMFHYSAILRKANEAIAYDHLVPFRVLHPAPVSNNADPAVAMSMTSWRDNMKNQLAQWRKDNLHIMMSPVPLGMTQMGGQGRALLTLGEVQEADKSMISALGIPQEFVYGGLTGSGMEATLRLIENQLETHINDLLGYLQWVADKSGDFLGWERISVGMKKFRMTDDVQQKNMVYQFWVNGKTTGDPLVSDETAAEMFGINIEEEQRKIKQETITRVRQGQEVQREIGKIHNSIAEQVRAEAAAQTSTPAGYDTSQVLANAEMLVQELAQLDEGTRRSRLHALETEDPVMYAVVIQRWEQSKTTAKYDASRMAGV